MSKDFKAIIQRVSKGLGAFAKQQPESMQGFQAMSKACEKEGALSAKQKELMALAIGVSQRCDGCIGFHVKKCVALGVTREELAEAMGVVAFMGGGPALMYVADALLAYDQLTGAESA